MPPAGLRQPKRQRARDLDDIRTGVIDIGSNSIRLVVFHGHPRAPIPLFNEKVLCGLGRQLAATGRLDPDGVTMTLENLPRFAAVAESMDVERLHVFATAAVRDAEDGPAFVEAIARQYGIGVDVLDGDEEARLSAYGVLSGNPNADGIMGDLGGGSLELVSFRDGKTDEYTTLPFGPFRLNELRAKGGDPRKFVYQGLKALDWLEAGAKREFYPVGGSWRAFARIHMAQSGYPLRVIDRYAVSRSEMADLAKLIERQSGKSLEQLPGVPKRRLDALPIAALLMRALLDVVRPKRVVFSAHGLREGVLFDALPPAVRRVDPLLAASRSFARRISRFQDIEDALFDWLTPLGEGEGEVDQTLRRASCILGDTGWGDHPSYRAQHAFDRAFRSGFAGIDHPGRGFLALAIMARYGGMPPQTAIAEAAVSGLDQDRADRAVRIGLGMRLAYAFSGGSRRDLGLSSLAVDQTSLTLLVAPEAARLLGEMVERRLRELAALMNRSPRISVGDAQAKAS